MDHLDREPEAGSAVRRQPSSVSRGHFGHSTKIVALAMTFGFFAGIAVAPTSAVTLAAAAKTQLMSAAAAPTEGSPDAVALTDDELAAAVA